jgi:hypothetical protein
MTKKFISAALAFLFIFTALSSCRGTPVEEDAPALTTAPETTEAGPDDPVINSFYADYVNFSFHPEDDYAYLIALNGTEEREKWERIYVDPEKNEDILIYYEEGEVYEVFYFGEITTMEDGYGYIEQLHSFRIASSPREYGGIDYSVSILRQGFNKNAIRSVSLNSQWKTTDMLMLLAESREEFTEMATDYFMSDMEIPQNATDLQRKTITYRNQRRQLLDGYDEDFFKNNDLLMIFLYVGSGSLRYDVEDISIESGLCDVAVRTTHPDGTCDMESWIICVSIPKEVSAGISEYSVQILPYVWNTGN